MDSSLSVQARMLDEHVADGTLANRFYAVVLMAVGGFGLALVGLSVFVVAHQAAHQRTREIGIRLALGASPTVIKWMFMRRVAAIVGCASGLGVLIGVERPCGRTRVIRGEGNRSLLGHRSRRDSLECRDGGTLSAGAPGGVAKSA